MDQRVRRHRRERWTPIEVSKARHRDERLLCPVGGSTTFGCVPLMRHRHGLFPAGHIYLKYGQHLGPHRGFGFRHIWQEHVTFIRDHDAALDAVRTGVAQVLRPGTAIHYETGLRLACFRAGFGLVLFELREQANDSFYSVVTGGYVPRNAKGPEIGALA